MSKSTEKRQVQKQHPISVQRKDNSLEPDLPLMHAIEIEKLLQEEYPKEKDLCQQLLDHYTVHHELPNLKIVTDRDSAQEVPTKGPEFLQNAIDKCLLILTEGDTRWLREESSNIFHSYAEEMMTVEEQIGCTIEPSTGKSTATSRDDTKNFDKQTDPMDLLTIGTSPVHSGPLLPSAVTETAPSADAHEVGPQTESVLTNLVSPPFCHEPNSTSSNTGVVIEAHLPDFSELAAAHVQ
jgi:hypothetical protein